MSAKPKVLRDKAGRTLFEVVVEFRETRTLYLWATDRQRAECAGEMASEILSEGQFRARDSEEPDIVVREVREGREPSDVDTFVCTDGDEDAPLVRDETWTIMTHEEVEAQEEAERAVRAEAFRESLLNPSLL